MNSAALKLGAYAEEQDALVERYAPLVKRIALHLKGRLPQTVQLDDLIQSGLIGLLEALRNYEQGHGASFETFAGIRIRGAMLDEVRRNDWVPRSVHRRSRELARAIKAVEAATGRDARDEEIAAQMGLTLEEYFQLLQQVNGHRVLSFEEVGAEDGTALEQLPCNAPGVVESLQQAELQGVLGEQIRQLPERERMVLSLYYSEELNLKEIGQVLGVSESRICQIHSQAVGRLKARLADSRHT
jgi:RNA polymerase sigma factor for flagellar operon FliA